MIIGDRKKRVFASTLTYELGRQLGIQEAAAEFRAQLMDPSRESLPVVRLFARLARLAEVEVYHGASTTLPKARSRAAHAALQSGCEYWLMCDDDVECDAETLASMLQAAGESYSARAVVLPCLMRGAGDEKATVNVQFDGLLPLVSGGSTLRTARRAGTGCMLLTREALVRLYSHYSYDPALDSSMTMAGERLAFRDDDGEAKLALFQLLVTSQGEWFGEDFSFCERLRSAGVPLVALLSGHSSHAGAVLDLSTIR